MPRIAAREREAHAERRRDEIVGAALRVFAARGFDAASVEEVAREAGLSKGTLYLYFESKQALLDEVVRRHSLLPDVERLAGDLRERPLEEVVPLFVRAAWRRLTENRDVIRVLFRELPSHLDHARTLLERVMLPANRLVASFLDEKLGKARARELNTLVAGRSLVGMVVIFFLTQEILGGAELLPIPEEEIASTISEVFLNGVRGA
jgi:AcrR family transcriptional regulator